MLFDESLSATGPATVIAIAAFVVGLAAMAALARSEAHPVGTESRPGAGARRTIRPSDPVTDYPQASARRRAYADAH